MSLPKANLGIDASKGYADFILLGQSRSDELVPIFRLDDTPSGRQTLVGVLSEFQREHGKHRILAGIESTGGYENHWLRCLQNHGYEVARLNPRGVKGIEKAGLVRTVTDPVSARTIAEYLIYQEGKSDMGPCPHPEFAAIRDLYQLERLCKKQKGQLRNQLEKRLYELCPGLSSLCRGGAPMWLLRLLGWQAHPGKLSQLSAKQIPKALKVSEKQWNKVQKKLSGEPLGPGADILAETLQENAQAILELEEKIKRYKNRLLGLAGPIPEVALLCTFTGMGPYSALALWVEIQGIDRFEKASQLACYFGLHPIFKQSGDGQTKARLSKQGRVKAREVLYMVARSALIHNPYFKQRYHQLKAKGRKFNDIMGIFMHKILRIVFGMLKNQKAYDPKIDQQNREKQEQNKNKETSKSPNQNQVYRFQKPSLDAPISRKNYKKRKDQELPQNMNHIECEVSPTDPGGKI